MIRRNKLIAALLFITASVWINTVCSGQDSFMVRGKILGGKNLPVQGVSVSIEGVVAPPVISSDSGDFQLEAPSGNVWLIIAPVSKFKSRREFLNNRSNVTIQLTEDDLVAGYDEILNIYRTTLRRDFISASDSPDPENTKLYPYQSIDQYFQGIVPGLLVTGHSGMPGSGAVSYLRGIRSIYTNNQPLYIVDGQPIETPGLFSSTIDGNEYNPLSSIDPLDITNITILKDYLASATYGMRGSNGVILIETLKPTEVETSIDISMRTGISMQPDKIPQLEANHYKTLANEMLISSGQPEEEYEESYPALYSTEYDEEYYRYNHNTNWQNHIFSNGLLNDYYLRIRGGDEIARYGLSVGYLNHQGIIDNTNYNRFNIRFVGTFNIFQWLRMYVSSNLNTGRTSLKESARSRETSPIYTSLAKSPLLIPYQFDEDGKRLATLEDVGPLGISNPLAVIRLFEGNSKNYRFATSFRVEGDLTQDLKLNSLIGLNFNSTNEDTFLPNTGMELYYDDEAYNVSKSLKNYLYSFYSDNYLNFSKELNNSHKISAAAGVRFHLNTFQIDWGVGKNSHESDEYKTMQFGPLFLKEMGGENAKWNRMAVYGNGGYSYKDRYFIGASIIGENSTRVGKYAKGVIYIGEQPFGLFYSAGAAWRISSEYFLKNLYWLEDLKLRVSYGIVGNDDIGNLSALEYYTITHYHETSGMIPGPITKQDIKFEVNKQLNTGVDLGLLGNKVYLSLDLYRTRTEDLLVFEPQPTLIGFTTIPANNGELLNKGWELSFFSRVISLGKFKWDIGLNLASFKNTVESIKDNQVITPFEGGEFISRAGEPVLAYYGLLYKGVFSTSEEAEAAGLTTEKGVPFGAGDAIFADLSGPDNAPDGVINEYDKTIIGSPIPDYFGGFSTFLSYGRWSLNTRIQFVTGNELYNYLRYQNEKMSDLANQSTRVLNRWFNEGQITDVPRAVWNDPVGNASFSTRWIEDGSYVRLKNISLSYTIPDNFFFFRNALFFVTATNLFTRAKYLGYDPEFSYSTYTMEQGTDYGLMPHTRKFLVGVKLGL
ncbi:MAG: SusC/RagA family TonB-linked outer membrane protein [Bacteroidales bacterium]|nr:SusC/RagA family TonB-linked outer membrane protein [Bacteroidales bacterium]